MSGASRSRLWGVGALQRPLGALFGGQGQQLASIQNAYRASFVQAQGPALTLTFNTAPFQRLNPSTAVLVMANLSGVAAAADVQVVGSLMRGAIFLAGDNVNAGHANGNNWSVGFAVIDFVPGSGTLTYTMQVVSGANLTVSLDGGTFALIELGPNYVAN